MHVEKFKDADGGWRLRLKGANGEVIMSSEAYDSKSNCDRAASRLHDELGVRVTTVRG